MRHEPEKREGNLQVIGQEEIVLNLEHDEPPRRIVVEFEDEEVFIPCDHHHHRDEVGWSCYRRHGGYFLTIAWRVKTLRLIKWHIEW